MSIKNYFYRVATNQIRGFRAAIVKFFLGLLSYVYGWGITILVWLYQKGILKKHRLKCPVVSVGNITAGGVGKTPLVIKIAQIYQQHNLKPVILTRGYMGKGLWYQHAESDEVLMMRKMLPDVPILVGADRSKNAEEFLKNNQADIFILDDGFQQWRLERNLDVVAIDATNPWGSRHLLPRGILREPLQALRRADLFILTKTDLGHTKVNEIYKLLSDMGCEQSVIETIHHPVALVDLKTEQSADLNIIKGQTICCLCSLGAPATFAATLIQLGAKIQKAFNFADHYVYNTADIQQVIEYCDKNQVGILLTTEKDAVKLEGFRDEFLQANVQFFSLHIELMARDEAGENFFLERIRDFS